MLKLKRNGKSQLITIMISKKENFLNRTFLIAFMIALSVHLIPFFVLKISKINLNYPNQLFSPTAITSDLFFNDYPENGVGAELSDLYELKKSFLSLALPSISIPEPIHTPKPLSFETFQAQATPNIDLQESLTDDNTLFVSVPKIRISISGPAATKQFSLEGVPDIAITLNLPATEVEQERLEHEILIDNASGKIIWISPLSTSLNKELNTRAENMLKHLNFEISNIPTHTSGLIETIFSLQKKTKE